MRTPDEILFGRDELLDAWLQWRRFADAHEDLRTYYERRWNAFRASFGVDLSAAGSGEIEWPPWLTEQVLASGIAPRRTPEERRLLFRLFERTTDHVVGLTTPFSSYLEAPPVIVGLIQRCSPALDTAVDAVAAADRALLIDLMEIIWGLDSGASVTAQALREAGFEPDELGPDPIDYW